MDESRTPEPRFKQIGGALCLDFVNTVGNWLDPALRRDHLTGYADLVAWGRQTGALSNREADVLAEEAARRPDVAATVLDRARELRAVLHALAAAIAHGLPAGPDDLATVNAFVGDLLGGSRLVPTPGGFALERRDDPAALDRVLWPIVRSAVDLLTSGELVRMRECADDACGWLFVDRSRGGRRRWCEMADCGNQAKVRRFRARLAGGAP